MKPRPCRSSAYISIMNVTAQAPKRVSTPRSVPARSSCSGDAAHRQASPHYVAATDVEGNREAPAAGQVVLSLPSPEALEQEAGQVRRVIAHAGTGIQPLV